MRCIPLMSIAVPISFPTPVPVSRLKSRPVFPSTFIVTNLDVPMIERIARIVGFPESVIPITASSVSVM